ncbi:hypothetical protein [Streptomyces sp. TRM70350]|uniref:hypothetical protein n=1 Tax=Streptomyces sp. TRM70350 TaxID=2856165 RepID=UPI001C436908|nr:hypothetical protein [Streptomyces sp. TRM70350]MBV7697717.1 hypothetical protein [Streptomyces sp. TRM70350]
MTNTAPPATELTPAQVAYLALADHCITSPCGKPDWHGDTPVHRPCDTAEDLYQAWRQRWREERG